MAQNKIQTIRSNISEKTGVPVSLLTATTEEDCEAQAQAILAFAKPETSTFGYPAVRDTGETRATGKKTTADLFGDWMNQNF